MQWLAYISNALLMVAGVSALDEFGHNLDGGEQFVVWVIFGSATVNLIVFFSIKKNDFLFFNKEELNLRKQIRTLELKKKLHELEKE